MKNPYISIVIPCFNHGKFIQEALDSIDTSKINYTTEVIIVDDGSTDNYTLEKLKNLQEAGYTVIFQENGGPAKARNTGIQASKAAYILPLDADNKILPDYINLAIPILESGRYDIVYGEPIFFGEHLIKKRKYKVRAFDDLAIVTGNCADACAIFRKDVWIKNKGYDTQIPYTGFEDWEFWIHAASNGFRFHFIKKKLFFYRIVENSVVSKYQDELKITENKKYIAKKHSTFYLDKLIKLSYVRERYDIDILRFPITPFIYILYLLKIISKPTERASKKFNLHK